MELAIISLPAGVKDPDELVKSDPRQWQQSIDAKQPAVDWVLEQYRARVDIQSAAGKRAFTTAALAVVRLIGDPIEQEHYERIVAEMTGSSLEAVRTKLAQEPTDKKPLRPVKATSIEPTPELLVHQDDVLAATCLDAPSQDAFGHINLDMFIGDERRAVASYFATHPGQVLTETPEQLQNMTRM